MYFIILANFLVTISLNNSLIFFLLHQMCVFILTHEYYMHVHPPLFFDTSVCMVITDLPSYSWTLCSVAASSLLLSPLNLSFTLLLHFPLHCFHLSFCSYCIWNSSLIHVYHLLCCNWMAHIDCSYFKFFFVSI